MVGGIENRGESMPKTRKSHPPTLKAKVAVEAIKAHKTAAQIAQMFGVHPTQVGGWKKQALAGSRNGNDPPNQCQGSDENRGHAQMRVWNTIDSTALACRIQFDSDKRVKWRRFLAPETFPPGTVPRSDRTMVATCICNRFACCASEIESS